MFVTLPHRVEREEMGMRAIATTALMALTMTGLSACNRGTANNGAAKAPAANNAASNSANTAAPSTANKSAGMDPAAFRAAVTDECAKAVRALPNAPAGLDVSGVCGCAVEATLTGQSDPFAYTQSPEGQQAFNAAIAQCVTTNGGAGAAPGAADDGAEEGEQ